MAPANEVPKHQVARLMLITRPRRCGGQVSATSIDDVVLITSDTEQMRELVDHQPDSWTLTDLFGVSVLVPAHFAAGIGDRQRNAARVGGAGVDDHQRVTEAAAMGGVLLQT
jgi:hypothetical protein